MLEGDSLDREMTILTAREAADYLEVSLYALSKIESEGGLTPFRTPGGHRRYSLKMLEEYQKHVDAGQTREPEARAQKPLADDQKHPQALTS
jgi:hypothetical protein